MVCVFLDCFYKSNLKPDIFPNKKGIILFEYEPLILCCNIDNDLCYITKDDVTYCL